VSLAPPYLQYLKAGQVVCALLRRAGQPLSDESWDQRAMSYPFSLDQGEGPSRVVVGAEDNAST